MFIELAILLTMIPSAIQGHIRKQFSPAYSILLEIIVRLLQSIRCVKLEVLAESIPLPILFESRRKKLQRFLSLPKLTIETLWFPSVLHWIKQTFQTSKIHYLAIDRTSWGSISLLIISLVWQRRGILLWCEPLNKSDSSSYAEQVDTLGQVLPALSGYKVVVLGDREFCSIKLGQRLGKDGAYCCLRLKRNTEVQGPDTLPQQLKDLGLVPGQKLFVNNLQVTQTKVFGGFNLAAKWKKRYRGFAPDEASYVVLTVKRDVNIYVLLAVGSEYSDTIVDGCVVNGGAGIMR